jgi:elongation factor P
MATTADFRNGMVFSLDGVLYSIAEFLHVKPGKGGAFVRTKLKNVRTGAVVERTFRAGEKIEEVRLERRAAVYLYNAGDEYYFMDSETYDQFPIPKEIIKDGIGFLKENSEVGVLVDGEAIISVELPFFVDLRVADTAPAFKGDTVSGGTKPAQLETGATIQVPMFLEVGDVIKVDTRTGTYIERV